MKKLVPLILFFLILTPFSGGVTAKTYPPLKLNWQWPLVAHDLYFFDLDQDGKDEIFLCSYNAVDERGYIYVLNESGHLIFDTHVEGYTASTGGQKRVIPCQDPNATGVCYEWTGRTSQPPGAVKFIWVGDLDLDKNLDIVADCRGKGVGSSYLLYAFERERETGLYIKNKRRWYFEGAYLITHASSFDFDGQNELIASSSDSNIYLFDLDGGVKKKFQLDGSVWDFVLADLNQDGETEIVVAYSFGITLIKDEKLWDFKTKQRVFDVEVLPGDGNSSLVAGVTDSTLYILNQQGKQKFKKSFLGIKGITTLGIDNGTQKEILLLAESTLYALEITDGIKIKWELPLSDAPRLIYRHFNQVFVLGKKFYSFIPNPDYIQNELAMRYLKEAKEVYPKNCPQALEKATQAKEIFWKIENSERLVECDNIIQYCSPSGEEVKEIELAGQYLSLGENYFNSGDLETARSYLKKALDFYLKWGHRENAIKCDSLLLKINEKLKAEKELRARKYYQQSLELLQQEDLENSSLYANKAQQIYQEIKDLLGVSNCQLLLLEIRERKNEKLSNYYFKEAQSNYEKKNFENLSIPANLAKEYYLKLNQTSEIQTKISRCDSFLSSVQQYQQAKDSYKKADQCFQNNDYENSTQYAKGAKKIFQGLGYLEGVEKCDALLAKIDKLTKKERNEQILYVIIGIVFFLVIALILWKKFK